VRIDAVGPGVVELAILYRLQDDTVDEINAKVGRA